MSIDRESLFAALARHSGAIESARLDSALEERQQSGVPLDELLVQRGDLNPEQCDALRDRLEALVRAHGDKPESLWNASASEFDFGFGSQDANETGVSLPQFEPTILSEAKAASPAPEEKEFDPEATSDGISGDIDLAMTAADAFSGSGQPSTPDFDPEATSAMGFAPTIHGLGSGTGLEPSVEAMGVSGSSSTRFRIMREHAKGGLGAVLVAFDEELRREVAVKEIQGRHADNPDSQARFLLEAEITGGLEHPGVVPVYSLGQNAEGRPYYAMRFIRGDSLRKAIDEFHDPENGPKDPSECGLLLRAFLRRFLDVCDALEYAHSRGVIHRDIKPDNIMLGPYGETLVVDWGLAKSVHRPDLISTSQELPLRPEPVTGSSPTLDGSAVGTPAYMSPEQAAGDQAKLGPPADIYSLGATLYVILSGVPAFTDRNLVKLLKKVRAGEFPKPREIKPEVPPALEAICLKAMAKEIKDRYASCRALADDLENWLADEPVSVYQEPITARAFRWARKHRTLVTVTSALVAAIVPILATSAILIGRERDRVAVMEKLARNAVEDMYLDVAETVLADLSDPREEEFLRRALGTLDGPMPEGDASQGDAATLEAPPIDDAMRKPMQEALTYYEGFAEDGGFGPNAKLDAARARTRIGDITARLGRFDEADASYQLALSALKPLASGPKGTTEPRRRLAEAQARYGALLAVLGRSDEAEPMLREAISGRETLVKNASDRQPRHDTLGLAMAEVELAELLKLDGRFQEAETTYRSAIERLGALADAPGAEQPERRELASACDGLGVLLILLDRAVEAEPLLSRARDIQSSLLAELPTVPRIREGLAKTGNSLGILLRRRGEPSEAKEMLVESVGHFERLSADFPGRIEYRRALARGHLNLGVLQAASSQLRDAEQSYRRAVSLYEVLVVEAPDALKIGRDRVLALSNLGTVLEQRGDEEKAGESYDQAVAAAEKLFERFPKIPDAGDSLGTALLNRGRLLDLMGDLPKAEADLSQAASIYETLARDHNDRPLYRQEHAACLSTLGPVLAAQGEEDRAEAAYRTAIATYDDLLKSSPEDRSLRSDLASCLANLGDLKRSDAEPTIRRSLAMLLELSEDQKPTPPALLQKVGMVRYNLGERLADLGKPDEAEQEFAKSAEILVELAEEPESGAEVQYMASVASMDHARLLLGQGETESAKSALEQSVANANKAAAAMDIPAFRDTLEVATERLVETLLNQGQYFQAAGVAAELAEALPDHAELRVRAAELLDSCIVSVESDEELDPTRAEQFTSDFGNRALAQLRVAIESGFNRGLIREQSSRFQALSKWSEFETLLAPPIELDAGSED